MMLSKVLNAVADEIATQCDRYVLFRNGCWLALICEGGMYAATDPYGVDKYFDASRIQDAIPNWITFWNEPRDERGNLRVVQENHNEKMMTPATHQ